MHFYLSFKLLFWPQLPLFGAQTCLQKDGAVWKETRIAPRLGGIPTQTLDTLTAQHLCQWQRTSALHLLITGD